MKMFSDCSGECPMFPPWITGFDWAEAGGWKAANVKLEDNRMKYTQAMMDYAELMDVVKNGVFDGRISAIITHIEASEEYTVVHKGLPRLLVGSIIKNSECTYEITDFVDWDYLTGSESTYRAKRRYPSKYAQILQPVIDRHERVLCDGTSYENGRSHGIIEGMKYALSLLESHDKKNREE